MERELLMKTEEKKLRLICTYLKSKYMQERQRINSAIILSVHHALENMNVDGFTPDKINLFCRFLEENLTVEFGKVELDFLRKSAEIFNVKIGYRLMCGGFDNPIWFNNAMIDILMRNTEDFTRDGESTMKEVTICENDLHSYQTFVYYQLEKDRLFSSVEFSIVNDGIHQIIKAFQTIGKR